MLKKHSKVFELVRKERKKKREGVPLIDCAEVANSASTSTKITQTVTVIRNTNWQKSISNPPPDTVQEVLSKRKVKKPQLSIH